jgi:hypothetical protein
MPRKGEEMIEQAEAILAGMVDAGFWAWAVCLIIAMAAFWLLRDIYFALFHFRSQFKEITNVETPSTWVVMIHGTWGRRTRFLREDNRLQIELREKLGPGAQFTSMIWSGANLATARKRATRHLRRALATRLSKEPSLRSVILIAHSHGGNVAYEAAKFLIAKGLGRGVGASESSKSGQPAELPEISVVALATPFLIEQSNPVSPVHVAVAISIATLLTLNLFLDAAIHLNVIDLALSLAATLPNEILRWSVFSVIGGVLLGAALMLGRTVGRRDTVELDAPEKVPRVFAIVSPNDEALAAIAFVKLIESLFRGAMRRLRRIVLEDAMSPVIVIFGLFLLAIVIGLALTEGHGIAGFLRRVVVAIDILGVVAVFAVSVVIALRVLFRFVSAALLFPVIPDAFRNCLTVEVHIAPAPPGACQMLTISPSTDPVIFHSDFAETIYLEPLLKWLRRRQRRGD